jgi:hypothetical protein
VLLASGLGLSPITQDLDLICISASPSPGIAAFNAALAWQFSLGNRKLVRLAGLDHKVSSVLFADDAVDGAPEVTVA